MKKHPETPAKPLPDPLREVKAELLATLGDLGALDATVGDISHLNDAALLGIANQTLTGLKRQVTCMHIQRDFLTEGLVGWFWQWNMQTGQIQIESSEQQNVRRKRYEFHGWKSITHPEDKDALVTLSRFGSAGFDSLALSLRIRDAAGGWRNMNWSGAVVARDPAGNPSVASGTLVTHARNSTENSPSSPQSLRLLANISHEVRTPMTAILGAAHLALHSNDPVQSKNLIETIKTSAESLVSLLDDTLDYAKLEKGMLRIEKIEFDLYSLIADLGRIHGLNAQQKNLRFLSTIASGTPRMIISDPMRIRQIVSNLLSNAVKFTNSGEIALNVDMVEANAPTKMARLCISVRDSGIGLHPEQIKKIFGEYSQAESSTARTHGGTGLGLSISKRLAKLLGGDISVESIPEHGSVFEASLRVVTVSSKERNGPIDRIGGHVLLCEPNSAQREILTGMLADLGVSAQSIGQTELPSAIERHDQTDAASIDAILVDAAVLSKNVAARTKMPRIVVMQDLATMQWNAIDENSGLLHLLRPFSIDDLRKSLLQARHPHTDHDSPLEAPDWQTLDALDATPTERRRILLAEDNLSNRQVLASMLRHSGFDVTETCNGAEAVEAFQKEPFAYCMILLDIQMPVMDGLRAAEEIRGLEERRSWVRNDHWYMTPILATTADAIKNVERLCLDAGMNGVMIKPITPESLLATIERTLAEAKQASDFVISESLALAVDGSSDTETAVALEALAQLNKRIGTTIVNIDIPLQWTGNDPQTVKRLVGSFLAEAPSAVDTIEHWIMHRKLEETAQLSHKIISSLDLLGAEEASCLLRAFYQHCCSGNHPSAISSWEKCKTGIGSVIDILLEIDSVI